MNDVKRDTKGRFTVGSSGGPGRPKLNNRQPKNSTYREQYVTRDAGGKFAPGTGGNPAIKGDKFYIAWHEGDFYKIGICKSVKSRLGMLRSNTPYKVEIIYLRKVKNPIDVEYNIKIIFADKCVHGEWFRFDDSDIEYIQEYVESFSRDVKSLQIDLFDIPDSR